MALKSGKKLNIILSTVLLGLFLYLAYRNVNFEELLNILKTTNYFLVFSGTFIGVVLGSVVRSMRWGLLLHPIKEGIPFKNLFSTTVVGYMVNNLIPRSGEFARPYLLGKRENISRASAFGTIIIERILDTGMFLLIFGISLFFFKDRISMAIPNIDFAIIILASIIFLLSLWILFTMLKTELSFKMIWFFAKYLPKRFHEKIENLFNSLVRGFKILKSPSLFIGIASYSLLLWIIYLASTFIPFYAFDIMHDAALTDRIWNANMLLILINVSMFVPAPAGTGPYHYVVKVTLVNIFLVSEAKALGYATATHLMAFILYMALGLYYFINLNYKFSEIKQEAI